MGLNLSVRKHAKTRGVWRHAPPGKILKFTTSEHYHNFQCQHYNTVQELGGQKGEGVYFRENTVCSPFLHASIGKTGEGTYSQDHERQPVNAT